MGLRHPEKRRDCGIGADIIFSADSKKGVNVEGAQEPMHAAPSMFDCVDLSRIPPRCSLGNDIALDSIRKEIPGWMASSAKNGTPPLELIRQIDSRWGEMPRSHTTLAVRLRGGGVVKSRLRLRWGKMTGWISNFASAPTVDRPVIRLLISTEVEAKYGIIAVDIARAFPQSQELEKADKYIAVSPHCILFGDSVWEGKIATASCGQRESPFGMLRHRTLYGSKCAPIRWFLALSAFFR